MKKLILSTILLIFILGTVGCKKEEVFISTDNVTTDTILAKSNGKLQVATVEDFDKTYYDLNELKDFVNKEIKEYNKKAGVEAISIEDVKLNNGKVVLLLTYSGMDQYANFNDVAAAYFNGGISEISLKLPSTLVSTKNGSLASTQEVLGNDKLKILVMNEPYDIIVDGTIKYYSENVTFVDDNKVQGAAEGMSIVVFKP